MASKKCSNVLNVFTVKTGDRYKAEYVNKMHAMLKRHLQLPFRFYCLTDDPNGLDATPIGLPERLVGWWNKLYLFSEIIPKGKALYLDLDQIILADITEIVEECLKHQFSCYADHIEWMNVKLGTALMTFEAHSLLDIFREFWPNREHVMRTYEVGGDQVYLGQFLKDVFYLDEAFPKAIASYKYDILPTEQPPAPEVKLVNFHGLPKPAHLSGIGWIKENWK